MKYPFFLISRSTVVPSDFIFQCYEMETNNGPMQDQIDMLGENLRIVQ